MHWDPLRSMGFHWDPLVTIGIHWDPLGSIAILWDPLSFAQAFFAGQQQLQKMAKNGFKKPWEGATTAAGGWGGGTVKQFIKAYRHGE